MPLRMEVTLPWPQITPESDQGPKSNYPSARNMEDRDTHQTTREGRKQQTPDYRVGGLDFSQGINYKKKKKSGKRNLLIQRELKRHINQLQAENLI